MIIYIYICVYYAYIIIYIYNLNIIIYRLFELFEEVWRPEVLWHGVVHARDDLVYRLFPRLFRILSVLDGYEKFA